MVIIHLIAAIHRKLLTICFLASDEKALVLSHLSRDLSNAKTQHCLEQNELQNGF